VWDLESGKELRPPPAGAHTGRLSRLIQPAQKRRGHTDRVTEVVITPDGRRAVSASADGTLKVWDLESGEELRTLAGHTDRINELAVTPDGRRVVSASDDGTLKVWDPESGTLIASFSGDGRVLTCGVADSTARIVGGDASGQVHILELKGQSLLDTGAGPILP
jgi:WD40 repeat protein